MKKCVCVVSFILLYNTLFSQAFDNSHKGFNSSICILDSIFTGVVLTKDKSLKISYSPLQFEDFKRTIEFDFQNIKKIEVDWDIEIQTLYKNPVYISTNGETSFTHDGKETSYEVSPSILIITLISDSTIFFKNIANVSPNELLFQTAYNDKNIAITLPLNKFEEKINNNDDLARFVLDKSLKTNITKWNAMFSKIQFVKD